MSGAPARLATEHPAKVAAAAFDAAGNRVVWIAATEPPASAAAARALLAQGPDPDAEILAVLTRIGGHSRARFYNPDGTSEPLCGNALRCLAAFVGEEPGFRCHVETDFGRVHSWVDGRGFAWAELSTVRLSIVGGAGGFLVDVGTPHRVAAVSDLAAPAVTARGRLLCAPPNAVNATFFARAADGTLLVRTLERGVAVETRSCGTGAIAAFMVARQLAGGAPCERAGVRFASGEWLAVRLTKNHRGIAVGGRASRLDPA